MPKNKDLKRLVRARMQKTGESYAAARQHLVAKGRPAAPPPPTTTTTTTAPAAAPVPIADYETLAGVKDATVQAKTGCTWRKWVEALDYIGAAALTHTQIARLVAAKWQQSPWWAQTITVGYERIRGRRAVHERTGGFAVTKTRTFAVGIDALAAAFTPANRQRWLGDETVQPRKSIAGKIARWKRGDGSTVEVNFVAKGAGKASAQLQHAGLEGAGGAVDKAAAAKWYTAAAERGSATAQHRLGVMLLRGDGVAADAAAGAHWLERAAAAGHAPAQHDLALCYLQGRGVVADRTRAHAWFERAAAQGVPHAAERLAALASAAPAR